VETGEDVSNLKTTLIGRGEKQKSEEHGKTEGPTRGKTLLDDMWGKKNNKAEKSEAACERNYTPWG